MPTAPEPTKQDSDLLEFGYEVDPDLDSLAKGAPIPDGAPGKPQDYTGITFPSKAALAAWLKHATESFLEDEQVVLAEEQQVPSPYKEYVVLTTSRLILVKTRLSRPPEIWIYNPKLLALRAVVEGAHSTLAIHDPTNKRLEIPLLHPQAAQRIEDVVRLMKVGRVVPPHEVPSRIAFEGVYPIEYYEAILGPKQTREVHSLDFGRHRLTLEAVTGVRKGFFLVRHYLETQSGYQEVDERIAPFRSNRAKLMRENGPPFQIFVLPASRESSAAILARHGITERAGAKDIRERYVQQVRRSALEVVVEALHAAGAQAGHEPGQYAVAKGSDNDYLHFNGRVFAFNKNGDAVAIQHIH